MKLLRRWGSRFGRGRAIGLIALIFLLAMRVADPIFIQTLRNQSFDLFQRIKPRVHTAQPVVIVDIDENSIERYGQWPWARTKLAKLVDNLANTGTAAIAFDIVFSEKDRLSPGLVAQDNPALSKETISSLEALPSNDDVFAEAISKTRVVVGQTSVRSERQTRSEKRESAKLPHAFLGPDPRIHLQKFPDLVQNLESLERAASGHGIFTVKPDPDGVFRKVPIIMLVNDSLRLSLAAELLRIATGGKAVAIRSDDAGIEGVVLARQLIKTDRSGTVWPYFSESTANRFISAGDVLDGKVPVNRLRGHLVLIGTSAVGLEDYRPTPMGTLMPGVEIHAQLLENILTKQLLFRPHYAIGAELLTIALLGIGAIILVPMLGAAWSFISASVLLIGYIGLSWFAFDQYRLLIDPTYPVMATVLVFILLTTANYLREEQRRKQIKGAFGQYISPALVDQLSEDADRLVLGGETRELSVLFSDVRGFTAISESYKSNPEGLTELMNQFLTVLSDAIMRHDGTIDKFMGDAVMAFWNAPLLKPDHAIASCRSALDMLKDVRELNQTLLAVHEEQKSNPDMTVTPYHEINVGIGVNTGDCVVGNMGSQNRFDYTALGDTVNIASRLEGQSKTYGIRIVLGNNTAKEVGDKMAMLELDMIRVKGRIEPERIFGLFGDEELAGNEEFIAARAMNRSMLASYRGQDWASAFSALGMLRELDDGLNLGLDDYLFIYETRIAEFRANPPGQNWDGVYTATSK